VVEMIATCPFGNEGHIENALSFREGEVFEVDRVVGEAWWWGVAAAQGVEGWLPASYLRRHKLAVGPTEVAKKEPRSSFLSTTTVSGVGFGITRLPRQA
jgi:hypothetical protein